MGDDPRYVDEILKIATDNAIDLIVPRSDEEASTLSENREVFEDRGITIACGDIELLEKIRDKGLTYSLLEEAGFSMPKWTLVSSLKMLREQLEKFLDVQDTVVAKPCSARGGRGVYIISRGMVEEKSDRTGRIISLGYQEFCRKYLSDYSKFFPALVMEELVGDIVDVDLLMGNGLVIEAVIRRRLDRDDPNSGHIIIQDERISRMVNSLALAFPLDYLCDIDIIYGSSGQPYVLEINPRPSGSVAISMSAGIPLIDNLTALVLNDPISLSSHPVGTVIRPYKTLAVS